MPPARGAPWSAARAAVTAARDALSLTLEPPVDLILWVSGLSDVALFVAPFVAPPALAGPGTMVLVWWYRGGALAGLQWHRTRAAFPVLKLHTCAHVTVTVDAKLLGLALVDCEACTVRLTSSTVGTVELLRCQGSTVHFHAPVGLCVVDTAHRVHLRLWERGSRVPGLISNSLDCTCSRGTSPPRGGAGVRPLPYTYGVAVPFSVEGGRA